MDKNFIKKTALELADQIIILENIDDKELKALKKEKDEDFIKNDCRDRIAKLEALLEEGSKEKDEMRITILALTEKVAQLTVKVEFLEKENIHIDIANAILE